MSNTINIKIFSAFLKALIFLVICQIILIHILMIPAILFPSSSSSTNANITLPNTPLEEASLPPLEPIIQTVIKNKTIVKVRDELTQEQLRKLHKELIGYDPNIGPNDNTTSVQQELSNMKETIDKNMYALSSRRIAMVTAIEQIRELYESYEQHRVQTMADVRRKRNARANDSSASTDKGRRGRNADLLRKMRSKHGLPSPGPGVGLEDGLMSHLDASDLNKIRAAYSDGSITSPQLLKIFNNDGDDSGDNSCVGDPVLKEETGSRVSTDGTVSEHDNKPEISLDHLAQKLKQQIEKVRLNIFLEDEEGVTSKQYGYSPLTRESEDVVVTKFHDAVERTREQQSKDHATMQQIHTERWNGIWKESMLAIEEAMIDSDDFCADSSLVQHLIDTTVSEVTYNGANVHDVLKALLLGYADDIKSAGMGALGELPPDEQDGEAEVPKTLSLRPLIENRLYFKLMEKLDDGLETIEGYNDIVDQIIDFMAGEQYGDASQRSNEDGGPVGKNIHKQLMKLLNSVKVPPEVESRFQERISKAGMLLK